MAKTIILEYNIFEVLKYVQSFSEGLAAIQTFKMKILFMTTHYCLVFFMEFSVYYNHISDKRFMSYCYLKIAKEG